MKDILKYLEYLQVVKKHSNYTINNYKIDLIDFYNYVNEDIYMINKECVNGYLSYLYDSSHSKRTISRKLSSLRGFYNYLLKNNKVSNNYFLMVKNPKKDNSLPKLVTDEDIFKLIDNINISNIYGIRNTLIIQLMYSTGIRVSELINIKINDLDLSEHTIRITGKGNKERIVIFGNNAYDKLIKYINESRIILNIKNSDYLFLNKYGNILSTRYIRKMINENIDKIGLDNKISPHMLRHTFATGMLNNGADLVSVKTLLGHSNLNTTSIYTHVSFDKIKNVYNNSHPRAK